MINMINMIKPHFKPEFRQEVTELVVDKGYSITKPAEAMGAGKSTVDKWAPISAGSAVEKKLKTPQYPKCDVGSQPWNVRYSS
jgi:hypothetical protein